MRLKTEIWIGRWVPEGSASATSRSSTAQHASLREVPHSILSPDGVSAALDCDVLVCCVDRPWPRHLLNTVAYSHLIPVIDGGIMSAVKADGTPQHVSCRPGVAAADVGQSSMLRILFQSVRRGEAWTVKPRSGHSRVEFHSRERRTCRIREPGNPATTRYGAFST